MILQVHLAQLKSLIEYTPRKINIEPENDGLEDDFDDFPFPGVYSQVPC